jgi:hypothetical protein
MAPDIVGTSGGAAGPGVSRRNQEIKTGEYAAEVYTVNALSAALAQQRFFLAGTGPLVLALAGNARATIGNPAGSGRNVYIARLVLFSNATGEASLFVNPTAGLPATGARSHLNGIVGAAAGVAVLKADTSTTTALSGGTDTGLIMAFPVSTRVSVDMPPLVLTPGVTLGINIPIAAASSRSVMSVYWFEEDV